MKTKNDGWYVVIELDSDGYVVREYSKKSDDYDNDLITRIEADLDLDEIVRILIVGVSSKVFVKEYAVRRPTLSLISRTD